MEATPEPLPGGWLCQYQITWLGHSGARARRNGSKIGNAIDVGCHSDGKSVGRIDSRVKMGQKVDRFVAVALREPSFSEVPYISEIFGGEMWID